MYGKYGKLCKLWWQRYNNSTCSVFEHFCLCRLCILFVPMLVLCVFFCSQDLLFFWSHFHFRFVGFLTKIHLVSSSADACSFYSFNRCFVRGIFHMKSMLIIRWESSLFQYEKCPPEHLPDNLFVNVSVCVSVCVCMSKRTCISTRQTLSNKAGKYNYSIEYFYRYYHRCVDGSKISR